jgi:hypothetical protein
VPVSKEEDGDAKKATAAVKSSGFPNLPTDLAPATIFERIFAKANAVAAPIPCDAPQIKTLLSLRSLFITRPPS